MANFYLDQWAYAYTATATATCSSSTVTISGCTGKISYGTRIVGAGFNDNTFVTSFGTGTGGNGTYGVSTSQTVSSPVSVTCTEGVPIAYNLQTPDWGVPQDGDGAAQAASTASATISIDCSTFVFTSGSSTFSVMGCTALTISGSSNSATNAQYSATLTTMLDNIAIAINLATALIANVPSGWQTNQVRDSVFARRNGNSLELMTRTGSASWNGMTALTWTNVTNSTSGTWSGGVSGCWGWLGQHRPMWPSQWADGGSSMYGLLGRGSKRILAGVMTAGDDLYIRGGKRIDYTLNSTSGVSLGTIWSGTTDTPIRIFVDDGTVWTADSGNMQFIVNSYGGSACIFIVNGAPYNEFYGKENADETKTFAATGTQAWGTNTSYIQMSYVGYVEHVGFHTPDVTAGGFVFYSGAGSISSTGAVEFYKCHLTNSAPAGTLFNVASASVNYIIENCVFDAGNMASAATGLINALTSSNGIDYFIDSCRFVNYPSGSRLFATNATFNSSTSVIFTNCDFGSLAYRQTLASTNSDMRIMDHFVAATTVYGKKDFFYHSSNGSVDWTSDLAYPTLYATLNDASFTPYVIRIVPTTNTSAINKINYLEAPRIGRVNTLGLNTLKITVNIALDEALYWDQRDISIRVCYLSGGVLHGDTTRASVATAFTASTHTWSDEVAGQVAWYPGPILHNKYMIELTTSAPVDADSEVAVFVRFHTAVGNNTQGCFLDPNILMEAVV